MTDAPLTKRFFELKEDDKRSKFSGDYYHKGAFLGMRAATLIQPSDGEKYDTITYTILKAQTLVFASALFWTRLLEVGNFISPSKSKLWFYMTFTGLPSIAHAVYASFSVNNFLYDMDRKYSESYFNKFLKNENKL